MRMRHVLPAVLLSLAAAAAACSESATDPEPDATELMRQATEDYTALEAALDDGFVQLSECVESPAGGMGFHYGHPARIEDAVIDPSLPEVLLYAPSADDGVRLVGVEFMVHEDAWSAAGRTGAPAIDGRTFDPPDPEHPDENLREFFTLHAWVWEENPAGTFEAFNPSVSCD